MVGLAALRLGPPYGWISYIRGRLRAMAAAASMRHASCMANYRRSVIPGGTWFFTVVIADRDRPLLTSHVDALRESWRRVCQRHPFTTVAAVVLPDHLHAIWTLPEGDSGYAMRWKLIKEQFSRQLPRAEHLSASRRRNGERGIWQRRYWEHAIRDSRDLASHVDYVHFNPVKHGHVGDVSAWPHSTFHQYVRRGWLPPGWGSGNTSRRVGRARDD